MVKLINEYGITVTPSHVYKCDTKEDFANIPSLALVMSLM